MTLLRKTPGSRRNERRPILRITRLLNPGHILAAADADRATFDAYRGVAKLEEMSGIAVAVVDVVQSPGPTARSIRHQTIENRHAYKGAAALRRIGIVLLVRPGPPALRIIRGFRSCDGALAHSAAPHGPTFTWAPSCASQRPLGSDAALALNSMQTVTAPRHHACKVS